MEAKEVSRLVNAPRLFGTNGIRGVAGKEIDSALAFRVGSALGTLFPKYKILIGRDGRISSPMLLEGVAAGLLAHVNNVEDLGLITTPALEFLVKNTSSSAGVMITASHNPPEYNGFKVVDSDGIEIDRSKEEKMELLIHRDKWQASYQSGQRVRKEAGMRSYFEKVVTPINTSMVVSEIASKRKGKLILTRVGSIEVARTVVRVGALLGGEENGGIFYAPHHPVRDGTIAAVLVVNAIIRNGRSLSKLLDGLPKFYMIKEKIPCKEGGKDRAIKSLEAILKGRISSSLDGIRVDLEGRGWILVRASGTEPLLRLSVEAKTENQVQEILDEFRPLVVKASR